MLGSRIFNVSRSLLTYSCRNSDSATSTRQYVSRNYVHLFERRITKAMVQYPGETLQNSST